MAAYSIAIAREVPEDGYHGDYIVDLAREIMNEHGDAFADLPPEERMAGLRGLAL